MATFFGKLLPTIDNRAEKVTAGNNHNAILTHEGKIYTWGDNSRGQLGNGTTTNSSTATIVNPSYLENPNSYSVYFDGTGDYLSIPTTSTAMHQLGNWTYECWIYFNALPTTGYQNIFGQGVSGQNSFGLFSANATANSWAAPHRFKVNQANIGDRIVGTTSVNLNTWYHLAVVRNSGVVTLYVNGVAEGTPFNNSTDYTFNNNPLLIGNNSICYISNFRFVQGTALYTGNFTPSSQPLTAITNTVLLTCQNSTFKDNSINGFSLTVSGNATPSTISPFNYSLKRNIYADISAASSTTAAISVNGELFMWGDNSTNQIGITSSTTVTLPINITATKLNNPTAYSVYFDGNGVVTIPSSNQFAIASNQNFTLECWVYLRSTRSDYAYMIDFIDASSNILQIRIGNSGFGYRVQAALGPGASASSVYNNVNYTQSNLLNKWTHLAFSRAGDSATFFFDGVGIETKTGVGSITIGTPTTAARLGRLSPELFDGYISNVRFVKAALYTSNFTPPTQPLSIIDNTVLLTAQNNYISDNSNNNFIITTSGNVQPSSISPFNNTYDNINWKSVSVGYTHTLALSNDNDLYAWGNNASGQLGNGTTTTSYVPQLVNHISSSSYSVLFDGSGDYLTFNGIPLTSDTTQFTIEAWIYPTSNANQSYIYAQYTGADARRTTFYRETDTTINFFHPDIGTNVVKSGATPNNTWLHVAVTRDSANTVRLFVNGTVAYTYNNFTNYPQQTNAQIGGVGASYFTGYISNLRVVKNVALYTANFTTSKIPLTSTAQTTLLTCQDFNINDLSSSNFKVSASFGDVQVSGFSPFRNLTKFNKICAGNGYSLALSTDGKLYAWGENSLGQLGIGNTTDQTTPVVVKNPVYDYSVYLDGSGDWLSITDTGGLLAHGSDNFTYECWIKPSGSFSTGYVFHQYGSVIDGINIVVNSSTGVVTANFRATNQADISLLSAANSIVIGKWNHVAIMRNAATLLLAVNGTVYSTAIAGATLFLENQNSLFTPLRIGAKSNLDDNYFKGYISNVRIIRGRALYTSTYTVPTQPFTVTDDTVFLGLQSNRLVDKGPFNLKITTTGNSTVFAQGPFEGLSYKWIDFNAGNNHTLLISSENTLFATGDNTSGKLGDGTTTSANLPVETFVNADRSVYFNGSSYLSSTLTGKAPGTGEFTYECWFFVDSLAATEGLFNTRSGATADGFNVYISTTGLITVGHTSTLFTASAKAAVSASKWYHFAITRTGTNVRAYLNYGQIGSFTDSTNFSSTTLNIGCTAQGGNVFNGYISNFRYLNYSLYNDNGFGIPKSYSVYFDGSGDYLTIPTNSAFGYGTGDFTIEFWVYFNTVSADQTLVSNLTSASSVNPHLYVNGTSNTIRYYTNNADRITGSALTISRWYHIAVSRASGSTKLFINGLQSGSTYTDSNDYGTTSTAGIGTYFSGGSPVGISTFNGYISNLRVVKGTALYTANFTPSDSPLTAITNTSLLTCQGTTIKDNSPNNFTITVTGNSIVRHFNPFRTVINQSLTAIVGTEFLSCQGTSIVDKSTNSFAITTTGTPSVNINSPFRTLLNANSVAAGENHSVIIDKNSKLRSWGSNTSGQLGTTNQYDIIDLYENNSYSVYFDGSGDTLTVPASTNLDLTGDFTVEFWVNATTTSFIVCNGTQTGSGCWTFYFNSATGVLTYQMAITTWAGLILTSPNNSMSSNTWTHIAVTRSGSSFRMFINGSVVVTTTNAGSLINTGRVTQIGYYTESSGTYYLTGYLSNLRIVKGTAVYTANFTPPTSQLTALAGTSLLTCQSSSIKDNSTNNFAITLAGNTAISDFSPLINQRQLIRTFTPKLVSAGKDHSIVSAPSRIANNILAAGKNNFGQLGDGTFVTEGSARFKKSQIPVTYSVYYDGASDYLIYPDSSQFGLGTGNFTIELWAYVSTVGDNNWIIDLRTAGGGSSQVKPQVAIFTGGGIGYYYGASVSIAATSASLITPNTWNHIAVVRNSGTSKIYLNGIERASAADTIDFGASATVTLGTVGDSPGYTTTEFTGYMSNLRLVKGVAVYTSNFTPPTAPLTAIPGTSLLVCQDNVFRDNSVNNFIGARTGEIRTDVLNPFGYLT